MVARLPPTARSVSSLSSPLDCRAFTGRRSQRPHHDYELRYGQSAHRIRILVIESTRSLMSSARKLARVAVMDYALRQQPASALKGTVLGIPGSDIECHPPAH